MYLNIHVTFISTTKLHLIYNKYHPVLLSTHNSVVIPSPTTRGLSPVLVSSRLTPLVSSWVTRVLRWSMVSCMALTRIRSVSFSFWSIEFSWNRSLKPSDPSSQATRFPWKKSKDYETDRYTPTNPSNIPPILSCSVSLSGWFNSLKAIMANR